MVEGIDETVLALGDEAYPRGSAANFEECYEPSWGRFKERTRPVPGNHEYFTEGASGYFEYFGEAAGDSEGSILQFVVGTRGAAENYTIGDPMENTEIYNDETDGVLRLKLEDNAHEWRFVPVAGESVTDSGSAGCH